MPKFSTTVYDQPPRRPRKKTPAAVTILMGVLLCPLVYEATLLCAGKWKEMMGQDAVISTPWLNRLASGAEAVRDDVGTSLGPLMRNLPWNPSYVVVFGLSWASIAALMLRR